MTDFYTFRQLTQAEQLALVFLEGQRLALRVAESGQFVLLYHLPAGFFVEVWFERLLHDVAEVRSFVKGQPLEPWAELVTLPE